LKQLNDGTRRTQSPDREYERNGSVDAALLNHLNVSRSGHFRTERQALPAGSYTDYGLVG
jgi:hypothetical protein